MSFAFRYFVVKEMFSKEYREGAMNVKFIVIQYLEYELALTKFEDSITWSTTINGQTVNFESVKSAEYFLRELVDMAS